METAGPLRPGTATTAIPNVNPGAYDVPGDHVDEDCDGTADDEPTDCDGALGVATASGEEGARAIDLCRTTTEGATGKQRTWGVISSDYVLPDGTTTLALYPETAITTAKAEANFELGFGILPAFGSLNHVQAGSRMLALSTGTARQPTDPGYQPVAGFTKEYTSGAPAGFPGSTPACPGVSFGAANDGAALRIVLRVPTNATSFSFDSNFFSYEFPEYVCSAYNDTYVVVMTPSPPGEPASANGNIAFDAMGNIISVNAVFFRCASRPRRRDRSPGKLHVRLPRGPWEADGNRLRDRSDGSHAVRDHASTDWLTTSISVAGLAGHDITLLFAIWDSTDGNYDSTVLIDHFDWSAAPGSTTTPTTTPAAAQ